MSSPESTTDNALSDRAIALARDIDLATLNGKIDTISPQAMHAILAALLKAYGANVEAGESYPVLAGPASVSGTDVLTMCGALLKAADLQVFELGMWQSWTGR
ncbi:MAG: hypothetical protein JWN07_1985 [Hyphomicrobiales bacterium]|jgi:hypothetical protein|nr:hypothetical protein [Hyphomicrobiales bacterium]